MFQPSQTTLYLIYDRECYFCNHSAKALKIKKSVGELVLINARENHELINEALKQGLDINEGIVVHYKLKFYHGKTLTFLLGKSYGEETALTNSSFHFFL